MLLICKINPINLPGPLRPGAFHCTQLPSISLTVQQNRNTRTCTKRTASYLQVLVELVQVFQGHHTHRAYNRCGWTETHHTYTFKKCTILKEFSKGKVFPLQAWTGLEGGLRYSSILSRRGWVVSTTPRPLYPREGPDTHCTERWVGPRAGLDVCEKSRPHRDSIPGPSSP
jgi:hypothetical protein